MAITSFLLNWIWEMSQMAGYREMAGHSFQATVTRCSVATLGDVAITFWIYALGALAAHNIEWGFRTRWNVYMATAFLGATHALLIEQTAIASDRWTYSGTMPIVPLFKIGLWPLLQLTLLTPFVVWLSSRYASRRPARRNETDSVVP